MSIMTRALFGGEMMIGVVVVNREIDDLDEGRG